MAGLTPTGFTRRTVEDMLTQVAQDHQSNISTSLDCSSSSPAGQWDGSYIKIADELWALAQAIYTAMDPDKNEGDGQDAIGAITGCRRLDATHSQARNVEVNLTIGTVLTVGSLAAVQGTNNKVLFRFVGQEPAVAGDPVVEANFTAPGTGPFLMRFEAVETGPVAATIGTLTVIVTPITGWSSVVNLQDAQLGRNVETASQMRARREKEISAPGSTPLDAMQAEFEKFLEDQENTGTVICYQNDSDVVDADGRPPHSIEVIIDDDSLIANNLIAQQILASKAMGIQTFGSTSDTAHDSRGIAHTLNFNRPSDVNVYFAITVLTDPAVFPLDGATKIKEAIVAKGEAGSNGIRRQPGEDVIWTTFFSPCYSVPGVIDVTVLHDGTAPAPGASANIAIGVRAMARFDVGRVAVTVT